MAPPGTRSVWQDRPVSRGQGGEVVLTALVEFQRGCARNFCSSISTDHSGNNVELGGELLLARGPLAQSDCDHGCIH